jgi:amino acid adenylation domain-containing protein
MKSAEVGTPTRSLPARSEAPGPRSAAGIGTLVTLFEAQVDRAPRAVALAFAGASLTYAALDERANQLASHLLALGVGPEVLVGLSAPRSIEMVVAILAILKAGGAYLPLDPDYPRERLDFMLDDAGISIVVTAGAAPAIATTRPLRVVSLDTDAALISRSPSTRPPPSAGPDNLAYVIYTSGSTGRPKGVMVEHGNVTRLFTATAPWFDFGPGDAFTLVHSYAFDFSVWEIWGALLHGGRLVLVPHHVSRSPADLHRLLRAEQITVLCQTPSAFRQLARAEEPLPGEALSELALRFVIFGGEALDPLDLQPFWARRREGEGPRLVNMYGITETTVHVTYRVMSRGDAPGESVIGRPIPDLQVHLLDAARVPVSPGEPGEIWVGGPGVARGYLGRPELTAERFVAGVIPGDTGRLYRTGDIARLLPTGDLEYLGRADDQVKIRGHRIELGEVLAAVAAHPGVRDALVVAREDTPGARRLVAYVVPRATPPRPGDLRTFVARRLPDYMVPAVFLSLPSFPLAPSGKIDRRALPAPGRARPDLSTDYAPPNPGDEQLLAILWAEVLGVDSPGIHDDFFELGGDSLLAVRVIVRAREALGRDLALQSLFEFPTIEGLARAASAAASAVVAPLVAGPRPPEVPLSFAQQRLWFLHQLAPEASAYNLPCTVRLTGTLDVPALERSLDEIVRRHEALRTTFAARPGGPVQLVGPAHPVRLVCDDLSSIEPAAEREARLEARCVAEFSRPFDLARGPLLRAALIRLSSNDHALLLPTHHIASDGWSMGVLIRELGALYEAFRAGHPSPLAPLELQYPDWSLAERALLDDARLAPHIAHFRDDLAGAPLVHELPTDRPRPAVPSRRGGQTRFFLDAGVTAEIGTLARDTGATPFMVLLAAFTSLLHRASGQDDVVVGTPTAGRNRREIEPLIGFFAGTVVLRARFRGAPTFRQLVGQIRERSLAAFAHDEVPFERLVSALRPDRDPRYSPLFQILFALQNPPPDVVTASGLHLALSQRDNGASAFDLVVQLWESSRGGLEGSVAHDTDLFDAATVEALIADFKGLLGEHLAHPDRAVDSRSPGGSPAEIEAALLRDPAVADAAVRRRRDAGGGSTLLAYLVASGAGRLPSFPADPLPPGVPPLTVVPIGTLPLTPRGDVDEAALQRISVLDGATVDRASAELGSWPTVARAAVLVRDAAERTGILHLTDLLPPPEARRSSMPPSPRPDDTPPPISLITLARARPLALADGGPLEIPEGEPRTLALALARAAERGKGISYVEESGAASEQSYAELQREALEIAGGLAIAGLRRGDRVLLQLGTLRAHFTTFWGCLLAGVIPATVAIAPSYEADNAVVAKLVNAWRLLDRPTVLTSAGLAPSLEGLKALFSMDGLSVCAVESLSLPAPAAHLPPSLPSDVAFLQLSSGSTGLPKAVQITHDGVVHHAHGVTRHNGHSPDDVSLNWLPVDHVVAMLTCHLRDVYLGCAQIQVATGVILADPLRLLDLMAERRVTHSFSPNFGFKLITSRLESRASASWDLRALKHLTNGGEQATLPVIRDFLRLTAPFGVTASVMQPAFGMAESCTGIAYNNHFDLGNSVHRVAKSSLGGVLEHTFDDDAGSIPFVDLGAPIPGVKIRIVDADDRLVSQGIIGRMQLQGAVVTPGYVNHPDANREAFTHDGWFNSGDLGFLEAGRLTLTGREKETIIVRGANLYCHEIEDVVSGVPGVLPTFAAACAAEDAEAGTEGVAVFFVPLTPGLPGAARVAAAIRARVTERLGVAPSHVIPLEQDIFPRTTSGKLQRGDLRRSLAAGRYAAIERALDLHLENERTVPDWFHRKVWRRKHLFASAPRIEGGITVVFLDEVGLGARVTASLEASGRRVVTIAPALDFARNAADRYRLDPACAGHLRLLFAELGGAGAPIESILHLATCDGRTRIAEGAPPPWQSLLLLVQALAGAVAAVDRERAIRLLVVSSDAQPVLDGDRISVDKAPLLGILQTLPQELPWLAAAHLDLASGDLDLDLEFAVNAVLAEERAAQRDREVAHRDGHRWIPTLERVDFTTAPVRPSPIEPGGLYLLTGGLGGIGAQVADELLVQHRAHVLVIGRSTLADIQASPRARVLEELQATAARSGGTLVYEAVDVTTPALVAGAVGRAEVRARRPLAGIFHLASTFEERALVDETPASFAATLRPKLVGAASLGLLLTTRPECLFLAFSSVNAFFGGLSAGAYSAANRSLEHFVRALRDAGNLRAHCLSWSAWDDVGLSRGYLLKDLSRARGFHSIAPRKGRSSLQVALRRGDGNLLIGLDDARPQVRRHTGAASRRLQVLTAHVVPGDPASPPASSFDLRDRFGTAITCSIRVEAALPLDEDGSIDARALVAGDDGAARVEPGYVAPRGDAESVVAGIWRDVLRVDRVGSSDNFFDLGGHSMLLAVVRDKLARAFGRELPIVEMFRHPTVAALAAHLSRESSQGHEAHEKPRSGDLDERARKQRAALEQPRRRALPRRKNDV